MRLCSSIAQRSLTTIKISLAMATLQFKLFAETAIWIVTQLMKKSLSQINLFQQKDSPNLLSY